MAASLPNEPDDLLITDELHHRIAHKADYQREKLAIQDLARQMAEQPDQVLPRLVHLAMELCGGQSAGISLYEAQPPGPGIFRWHHLAGRYANFSGGTAPRDFSPSGVCFDVDQPILMARPERVYAFYPRPGFPITKSCLCRSMPVNPIRWARFGSFHTMKQFISTAAMRG